MKKLLAIVDAIQASTLEVREARSKLLRQIIRVMDLVDIRMMKAMDLREMKQNTSSKGASQDSKMQGSSSLQTAYQR